MQQPIIEIQSGKIQGKWTAKNKIAAFKGIPYAAPPVGEFRWKAPQSVESWEGIKQTTKFSDFAWQQQTAMFTFLETLIDGQGWNKIRTFSIKSLLKYAPRPKQSEDCLYLNVKTPSLDKTAKLPVMVWIHGGDHQDGSAAEIFYDGNAIPEKGVVFVSINYRLGLMGYFAHPELKEESAHQVAGNYGTLDQIAALKWVQQNIKSFGGDPDNVTIFGESAGGESVVHMLSSPLAKGLFHRAIMQSPANAGQMIHLDKAFRHVPSAEHLSTEFTTQLGIKGENQLEQLRKMPAKDLMKALRTADEVPVFYPNIDGYVLPKSPLEVFADNEQHKVPILLDSNADEGSCIYPMLEVPIVDYKYLDLSNDKLPQQFYDDYAEDAAQLCTLYPGIERRDLKAESDLLGDEFFGGKVRFYTDCLAKHGQQAFFYFFKRVPPSAKQTAGAFHAAELSFVHGTNTPVLPLNSDDKVLSEIMINYWTNFAKAGNPNGSSNPNWEAFDHQNPEWMELDINNVGMSKVSRDDKYQILNKRTVALIDEMKKERNVLVETS